MAINDKSQFNPKGINSQKLKFESIKQIDLYGPWGDNPNNPWTRSKTITNRDDINKVLAFISSAKKARGGFQPSFDDGYEEYMMTLYYDYGPQVRVRLYNKAGDFKITIDNIYGWRYHPSKELLDYVQNELG